jgi:aryl-alcohol dehydrogenase-like predicted oxidoreductase
MTVERCELVPGFSISRIIKGGWQLSEGHSGGIGADPLADMEAFSEAGITSFDCADIYTGVETLIGRFLRLRRQRQGHCDDIQILTKCVPDRDALPTLARIDVERIIDRSLQRLGVECLDVVQFHWWDYAVPGMEQAALWLQQLQRAGKIRLLSGTNFNTQAVQRLVDAGVVPATLQVQYSLLDSRVEQQLLGLCQQHGIRLLCYGTVAGGFLGERWLDQPEPQPPFENRSLLKYKLVIDEFGGWDLFQQLLQVLARIAGKHRVGIASVAARYMLDRRQVAGLIIGARSAAHLQSNLAVFGFKLDDEDRRAIGVVCAHARGPTGDVFDMERLTTGPHAAIMRYNLNSR